MPPPEPQRRGAADAGLSGRMPPPKQHHQAKGITGSISGGASQKQHRAKETVAGKGSSFDEDMNPRKRLLGNEKVGTVSCGGGALHKNSGGKEKMRRPFRLPNRMPSTTITQVQADGEKNTESNTSEDCSLSKCQPLSTLRSRRFAQLDIKDVNANAVPSMDAPHCSTTAQDWRESTAKHCAKEKASMSSSGRMLQKHRANQMGLNGEMPANEKVPKGSSGDLPQKQQAKQEMRPSQFRCQPLGIQVRGARDTATQLVTTSEKHTSCNKSLPRNSSLRTAGQQLRTTSSARRLNARTGSLDGNSAAQDCKESAANENSIVTECKDLQEANDAIQRLNEFGLGEDISPDEYIEYLDELPDDPVVNTYIKLDTEQMIPIYIRHARYRIRYYKMLQKASKDKQNFEVKEHYAMDLLEKDDFSEKFLDKNRYFMHFEKDGTLDWSFDPDLCRLRDLDDYHRLVPRNYDGCKYVNWDQYRMHFYNYEAEHEYLDYYKELSKKLKWMEDYVLIDGTSLKWGKISTRGAYQAMKIATGFSKITPNLAYTGYYECLHNMRFDAFWFKEIVGVYFEIWLRVTKQKKSFICALEEVYKLNKFPRSQKRMKYVLENDCSNMEMEFHTYTASVTSEVTEDEAHELIAEAAKKLAPERPKFYEHYIQKKRAIAQAIGLIPTVQQASAVRATSGYLVAARKWITTNLLRLIYMFAKHLHTREGQPMHKL
uniref:Uncharacterized protein n=2 Tax=Arundo donax TaxID=35708 RepID=A0A0A9AP61_ARUDO